MIARRSLFLALATLALAGAGHAQQRPPSSREDLLDALTRHIQICAEITETQARLSCYDRLQTQVGGVQPSTQPTPTPLRSGTGNTPVPQPLGVPGGGVATLGRPSGGGREVQTSPAPSLATQDPDAAFDPRSAGSGYRPPEGLMPKPQPPVRRTGSRPIPSSPRPQPLVTIAANNLTYGDARYWQVSIALTSNTPRAVETQAQCTFMNAGRPVAEAYFGPVSIAPGEQISTELIGPPTTAYVDSTNCKILSP